MVLRIINAIRYLQPYGSDGLSPAARGRVYNSYPPLNCVRQARAIALVRIAEPPQQKRNFVPQSPPLRGLRSLRSESGTLKYIIADVKARAPTREHANYCGSKNRAVRRHPARRTATRKARFALPPSANRDPQISRMKKSVRHNRTLFVLTRVEDGIRTHDLRNHNPSL